MQLFKSNLKFLEMKQKAWINELKNEWIMNTRDWALGPTPAICTADVTSFCTHTSCSPILALAKYLHSTQTYTLHGTFHSIAADTGMLHSAFYSIVADTCTLHSAFHSIAADTCVLHSAFHSIAADTWLLHSTFHSIAADTCMLHSAFHNTAADTQDEL